MSAATPAAWALCRDGEPIDIHPTAQDAREAAETLHRQAADREWKPDWRTFDGSEHLLARSGCCGRETGYSITPVEAGYLAAATDLLAELDQPANYTKEA